MLTVTVPLHALALRPPGTPEPVEGVGSARFLDGIRSVTRSRAFLPLTGALDLGGFGAYGVGERGLDTDITAWVLDIGGVGQLLGRLAYGTLHRRTSVRACSVTVLAVCALTIALLAAVPSPVAVLFVLSTLAGTGRGFFILLQATAISDGGAPHTTELSAASCTPRRPSP